MRTEIDVLVDYMQLKIKHRDWHAVSDVAMDIREIEARTKIRKTKKGKTK